MPATTEEQRARNRERARRYRARNREQMNEKARLYKARSRAADPERHREYARQWAQAHPGYYREYQRRYYTENRDRLREGNNERATAWAAANPERRREISRRSLLKAYGLTTEAHDKLLAAQGGGCAICRSPSSGRKGRVSLYVDHDHGTGAVRGLLCFHCNTMLGNARDSADRLRAGAEYLDRLSIRSVRDLE